jgi:hypothetical protein
MVRLPPLRWLVLGCLAIAFNGMLPCSAQLPPESLPCDYVLLPQTDPGGCASSGNPVCGGGGGGSPCCRHFHMPMSWNQAVRWMKPTGLIKGPPIKKYYTGVDSTCSGNSCVPGPSGTDYLHYVWEDTLIACPE